MTRWWMRPFRFIDRCQREDVFTQVFIHDVRGLDLRVRFDRHGKPYLCHGLARYEGDVFKEMELVRELSLTDGPVWVRVLLELTPLTRDRRWQKACFVELCRKLDERYHGVLFWGGWSRDKWGRRLYDFKRREPRVDERYSSVTGHWLDGLHPWAYARDNNAPILARGTDKEFLMIDFVDWRK